MEQEGQEEEEEEEGADKETGEGGLAAVVASRLMEAAGQIDLNDGDPAAPEEDPVEEPQPREKEAVSATARWVIKTLEPGRGRARAAEGWDSI